MAKNKQTIDAQLFDMAERAASLAHVLLDMSSRTSKAGGSVDSLTLTGAAYWLVAQARTLNDCADAVRIGRAELLRDCGRGEDWAGVLDSLALNEM